MVGSCFFFFFFFNDTATTEIYTLSLHDALPIYHIRGLSPFPGAWFEIAADGRPMRIKVLCATKGEGLGPPGTLLDDDFTIACGEGALRILELQRAGRQPMTADEFLRGTKITPGTRFGS